MNAARAEEKANKALREKMSLAEAMGRDGSKYRKQLEQSDLYQMEQLGLATNTLDGLRGKPTLLNSMLSDATGGKLDKIMNTVMLNQGTKAGNFATSLFSTIDTASRFASAQGFRKQINPDTGVKYTMQEAVTKANGLYADMDAMAPTIVEFLDKYPFVPFAKWFMASAPGILKLTKEKPMMSLAMGIGLYSISQATDTDTSTINPVESVIDFALDKPKAIAEGAYDVATGNVSRDDLYHGAMRQLTPMVIPGYMRELDKMITPTGDDLLFSTRKSPKEYGVKQAMIKNRRYKSKDGNFDNREATQTAVDLLMGN